VQSASKKIKLSLKESFQSVKKLSKKNSSKRNIHMNYCNLFLLKLTVTAFQGSQRFAWIIRWVCCQHRCQRKAKRESLWRNCGSFFLWNTISSFKKDNVELQSQAHNPSQASKNPCRQSSWFLLNSQIKINLPILGVSFEKVGAQIAQKFGLVHVDGTALLNQEVQKKTRIGAIISDCFQKNNLGISLM